MIKNIYYLWLDYWNLDNLHFITNFYLGFNMGLKRSDKTFGQVIFDTNLEYFLFFQDKSLNEAI